MARLKTAGFEAAAEYLDKFDNFVEVKNSTFGLMRYAMFYESQGQMGKANSYVRMALHIDEENLEAKR